MTTCLHILDLVLKPNRLPTVSSSHTIFQDKRLKAVVFGLGQRQELSEHTAPKPAMLFFVKVDASLGLGNDVQQSQAASWSTCQRT